MDTKTFSIGAVLTIVHRGTLLGDFSEVHQLVEHMSGHPVWTREMASRELWDRLADQLLASVPQFRDVVLFVRPERQEAVSTAVSAYVANQALRFGQYLTIPAGTDERAESPLDSLRRLVPDEKIVAVVK